MESNKTGLDKFSESVKNKLGSDSQAGQLIKSVKKNFDNDSKIGQSFTSMKNRMGIGTPERNATDTYERDMNIVPECISAYENETPVKQYNIAVLRSLLKFERAEGRIQVTNKRVILRATGRSLGGRTTLQHEYAIDEIAGFEARSNYRFSFLYLIFSFLIIAAASLIIHRPPSISGILSPLNSQYYRIQQMMSPRHLARASINLGIATAETEQALENAEMAAELLVIALEAEEIAEFNAREGIERTRRVQTGTDWWGNAQFRNEVYRDNSPEGLQAAREILETVAAERAEVEAQAQEAAAELEAAQANQARATRRLANGTSFWKIFLISLGIILGIGGLIPFFVMYKKFGLKLFILNFSIFGFELSHVASGVRVFHWLFFISVIIALICIFIYCFRPNLVISIKNKIGTGKGPVDIRSNDFSSTAFAEVIPTEETESAIREIGAIIGDLKKLGDAGLERWIKK